MLQTQNKSQQTIKTANVSAQIMRQRYVAKQLMNLLGVGAAAGAGVRGLAGFRDMLKDNVYDTGYSAQLPKPMRIPGPQQEKEQNSLMKLAKRAGVKFANIPGKLSDMASGVANNASDMLNNVRVPWNVTTTSPIQNGYGIPAGMLALGGGAYGGYKLIDWLLDKERNNADVSQVDKAKQDYQQALAEQYRAAMQSKTAEAEGIDNLYDMYADHVQKHGRPKQAIFAVSDHVPWFGDAINTVYNNTLGHDNWEKFKGVSNAAALATALGAGTAAYKWTRGDDKRKILEKAIKQRRMQRRQMSPAPLLVTPENGE